MGPLGGQTISLDVSHVKDDALNRALQYCGGRLSRQESIFVPFTFSIVILLRTIYLLLTLCHTLGYMLCRVIIFSIHKKDYEADTTIIPILWRGRQRCGTWNGSPRSPSKYEQNRVSNSGSLALALELLSSLPSAQNVIQGPGPELLNLQMSGTPSRLLELRPKHLLFLILQNQMFLIHTRDLKSWPCFCRAREREPMDLSIPEGRKQENHMSLKGRSGMGWILDRSFSAKSKKFPDSILGNLMMPWFWGGQSWWPWSPGLSSL